LVLRRAWQILQVLRLEEFRVNSVSPTGVGQTDEGHACLPTAFVSDEEMAIRAQLGPLYLTLVDVVVDGHGTVLDDQRLFLNCH
jgi:hypothetical protein